MICHRHLLIVTDRFCHQDHCLQYRRICTDQTVPSKILDQFENFKNFFLQNQLIFDKKILSWRKVKIRTRQPPFTGMSRKLLHGLVELVTLNIRPGFRVFREMVDWNIAIWSPNIRPDSHLCKIHCSKHLSRIL